MSHTLRVSTCGVTSRLLAPGQHPEPSSASMRVTTDGQVFVSNFSLYATSRNESPRTHGLPCSQSPLTSQGRSSEKGRELRCCETETLHIRPRPQATSPVSLAPQSSLIKRGILPAPPPPRLPCSSLRLQPTGSSMTASGRIQQS